MNILHRIKCRNCGSWFSIRMVQKRQGSHEIRTNMRCGRMPVREHFVRYQCRKCQAEWNERGYE